WPHHPPIPSHGGARPSSSRTAARSATRSAAPVPAARWARTSRTSRAGARSRRARSPTPAGTWWAGSRTRRPSSRATSCLRFPWTRRTSRRCSTTSRRCARRPMSTAPVIHPRDEEKAERFRKVWDSPRGINGIIREINNIPVAHRYMASAFSFFLAAGLLAIVMRTQLARPDSAVLDPETYNQLFTMHGTTMMFLFVIPFTEAVATYMLPLMLGTRDLPFPRLTALSLWTFIFGGLFIFSSFLFGAAPNGGWFA